MHFVRMVVCSYDCSNHRLPPAVITNSKGHPLSSWRLGIWPYADSGSEVRMDMRFDAKWDDPVNRRWASRSPNCYCLERNADVPGETNIVAVTGPGTAFDPARQWRLVDLPPDTILFIEIANSGLHWMQPGDLSIDHVPATITSGLYGRGVHVGFADGFVWFLRNDVPLEKLKKFLTIDGASENDRDVVLRPYLISEYPVAAQSDAVEPTMHDLRGVLDVYELERHYLPPAVNRDSHGRPLSSWRFGITPFFQSGFTGMRLDARWDDPINRRWASKSPRCYCFAANAAASHHTNIVAVTGPGTAFDPARQWRSEDLPIATILLIEIANSGLHWMQPGDLSIDHVPPTITSGLYGKGVHVVFANGDVWFLKNDVPLENLKKFFTIDGAKKNDRNVLLRPYLISVYPPEL
jgi:hypothetical protein